MMIRSKKIYRILGVALLCSLIATIISPVLGTPLSSFTSQVLANPDLIAVAPDNANIIAKADTITNEVWISDDGGINWYNLGTVKEGDGAAATSLYDITISAGTSISRVEYNIAVAGTEAGPLANVWYYNLGASAPSWKETNNKMGFGATSTNSTATAVAFSPNFSLDKVMVAVTEKDDGAGDIDNIDFEIFSLNVRMWNEAAGFMDYPVTMASDDGITGLTSTSISLDPTYLGADDTKRIAFVGLTVDGDTDAAATSGIYRLKDIDLTALKTGEQIHSIAYNGSNLVAGEYNTTNVLHSSDPLVTMPTVSNTTYRPDGDGKVVVDWISTNVVAGTSGTDSAFSRSTNNGETFSKISSVAPGSDVSNFTVASDNITIYAADKEGDRIYKSTDSGISWTELTKPSGATEPQIVAVAPGNANSLALVADDNEVYVSDDGGINWYNLGTVKEGDEAAATALYDITIACTSISWVEYNIAVAGTEAGPLANVWYFNLGAPAPSWKETNDKMGFGATSTNSMATAVAFSPNFSLDKVMVAVTEKDDGAGGIDNIDFEIFSLSARMWNEAVGFMGYPVTIASDDGITGLDSASILLDHNYLGTDDTKRIAFVNLSVAGDYDATQLSGWYRLDDIDVSRVTEPLIIEGLCPIDLSVLDPDGLSVNKQSREITEALYSEKDMDGDGDLDDTIIIPNRKIGDYRITSIPEPEAKPTDTFTLKVTTEAEAIILAENKEISNIPSQGYIVRSTETSIEEILPATLYFYPRTLNLRSGGQFVTAYIELPQGHSVVDIHVSTLFLNDTVAAEPKPIEIGDYDEDGIPDLMVKFDRTLVHGILDVGDEVEVIITGACDGVPFEGSNTIRVINR